MITTIALTAAFLVGAGPVEEPVTPVPGTEGEFILSFLDDVETTDGDMLSETEDTIALMGEAVENMEFDLAASYGDDLAATFSTLEEGARTAPGNTTPLGVMVIDAMDSCADAYSNVAQVLRDVDVNAFEGAIELIGECNDDLGEATERMGGSDVGTSDSAYESAYDAWLGIPAGDDLCPEYEDGTLSDDLIAFIYPDEDADAVEDVLADNC